MSVSQRPGAVFSSDGRWARVHVERIRALGGVRATICGARRTAAGLDVRRSDSDVSRRRNALFYISSDSHVMVVSYTVDGNTFGANPPQKWSEQLINERPTTRPFDLHPDGDRFVVSGDLASPPKVDKVILVPNCLDEVRRRLSDAMR
jgi:hypothetical protein